MLTVEELLTFAKTHKSEIQKNFYGAPRYNSTKKPHKVLERFFEHERRAMLFLSIEEPKELCTFFDKDFFHLEKLMNEPEYKTYKIRKKQKGKRKIHSPASYLKTIQKKLNRFLQAYYLCMKPEEVHGFVINPDYLEAKCNIVENARVHTGKKYVLNIDLKNFFPSISAGRVKQIFTSPLFGFNDQIATALTLLTTYEGKLPTGAPTSPVISNFVCFQLDNDLKSFSEKNGIAYSRYADDLTFSFDILISNDQITDLVNLIHKNNFEVNQRKLRMKTSNRKQTVTGLIVNDKVNVDRKLIRRIRAMLHDFSINGLQLATIHHLRDRKKLEYFPKEAFCNRLEGYINFVGQVRGKNDPLYIKFKKSFDILLASNEK